MHQRVDTYVHRNFVLFCGGELILHMWIYADMCNDAGMCLFVLHVSSSAWLFMCKSVHVCGLPAFKHKMPSMFGTYRVAMETEEERYWYALICMFWHENLSQPAVVIVHSKNDQSWNGKWYLIHACCYSLGPSATTHPRYGLGFIGSRCFTSMIHPCGTWRTTFFLWAGSCGEAGIHPHEIWIVHECRVSPRPSVCYLIVFLM